MKHSLDRETALLVLASIAASYTRRELDRRVYDEIMASRLGKKLKNLTLAQKHAFEFIAYAGSALALNLLSKPGPTAQYLREVLTDIPSEIARRMINGGNVHKFQVEDVSSVMNDLSDEELEQIACDYGRLHRDPDRPTSSSSSSGTGSPPVGDPIGESLRSATRALQTLRERRRRSS